MRKSHDLGIPREIFRCKEKAIRFPNSMGLRRRSVIHFFYGYGLNFLFFYLVARFPYCHASASIVRYIPSPRHYSSGLAHNSRSLSPRPLPGGEGYSPSRVRGHMKPTVLCAAIYSLPWRRVSNFVFEHCSVYLCMPVVIACLFLAEDVRIHHCVVAAVADASA